VEGEKLGCLFAMRAAVRTSVRCTRALATCRAFTPYRAFSVITPPAKPQPPDFPWTLRTSSEKRYAWIDIAIGSQPAERVVLAIDIGRMPKCGANFMSLCAGDKLGLSGKPLHYKSSQFHRIIPNLMIQAGDITKRDGSGGESIYGPTFRPDHARFPFNRPGMLAMATRGGGHSHASQFFITTQPAPWLDDKFSAFGYVHSGMAVVKRVEVHGTMTGDAKTYISITDCGVIPVDQEPAIETSDDRSPHTGYYSKGPLNPLNKNERVQQEYK